MIKAERVGVEGLLRLASAHGIRLWDVKRVSYTTIVATMSTVGYFRLKRALKKAPGFQVNVLKTGGGYNLLAFFRKRWLLPAGALVLLGVMIVSSLMCFEVTVQGAPAEEEYALYTLIEENGGVPFVMKSQIDTVKIEKAIREQWPSMLYVNARFDGTTLVVEVDEGESVPPVLDSNPVSIVASTGATVESIVVGEGLAAVREGDIVEKGDLLIAGRYEKNEFQYDVHARGQVIGRVDYLGGGQAAYSPVEYVRTGKTATVRYLQLGSRRIKIQGENPFENFEEESEKTGSFGANFPIHGDIIQTVYYETKAEPSEKNRDRAITEATEAAYFDALKKIQQETSWTLVDFFSYIKDEQGKITVAATVTTRQNIGETGASKEYYTQKEEEDRWN